MPISYLSAPHFHDEESAFAFVEARVWPNGAACPRCGAMERVGKLKGNSTRLGGIRPLCISECRPVMQIREIASRLSYDTCQIHAPHLILAN
jgi:Transposase zinc-ribbon domain